MNPEEFKARLVAAFPPRPFQGPFNQCDCDECIGLARDLVGKRWDELTAAFVLQIADALPLLEPEALVAFLPAWLQRSAEAFPEDNSVVAMTVCFLCPGSQHQGWDEAAIAERVALFDPAQRGLVVDLLREVRDCQSMRYWHAFAEFGLRGWGRHV